MKEALPQRFDRLVTRLRTGYESIGQSQQHPYLYVVTDPSDERELQASLATSLHNEPPLLFFLIDLLPLTIESLMGQEKQREELLQGRMGAENARAIVGRWARKAKEKIEALLESAHEEEHPVIVFYGTAALHPVGDPSMFMQFLDELYPCVPKTGRPIPIVVFIPGFYPPQTSRSYSFLSASRPPLTFWYGEYL